MLQPFGQSKAINMNRFDFYISLGAATAFAALSPKASAQALYREDGPSYAMRVHPTMIIQDLGGPMTVFTLPFGTNHLVGNTAEVVSTDLFIPVTPNQPMKPVHAMSTWCRRGVCY